MKAKNPFDDHVTINDGRFPFGIQDSATFVVDTLTLAWKGAQAVFEDRATPEVALAMYDRIAALAERRRAEAERAIADAGKDDLP